MYQARLHPEQYSNTFSDEQVKKLHDAMMFVCNTACDALGDSDQFPEDWLMKHRWGKGKKDANKLPNGAKITFLKVGGRTSAIVPSVQKKTGTVAGDVSEGASADEDEDEDVKEEVKPKKGTKRTKDVAKIEDDDNDALAVPVSTAKRGRKLAEAEKIRRPNGTYAVEDLNGKVVSNVEEEIGGRRRSGRLAKS